MCQSKNWTKLLILCSVLAVHYASQCWNHVETFACSKNIHAACWKKLYVSSKKFELNFSKVTTAGKTLQQWCHLWSHVVSDLADAAFSTPSAMRESTPTTWGTTRDIHMLTAAHPLKRHLSIRPLHPPFLMGGRPGASWPWRTRPEVPTWARNIRIFRSWQRASQCPTCTRTPQGPSLRPANSCMTTSIDRLRQCGRMD